MDVFHIPTPYGQPERAGIPSSHLLGKQSDAGGWRQVVQARPEFMPEQQPVVALPPYQLARRAKVTNSVGPAVLPDSGRARSFPAAQEEVRRRLGAQDRRK